MKKEIVLLGIEIDPELKKRIRFYAAEASLTIKEVVTKALESYLEKHPKKSLTCERKRYTL